MSQISLKHTGLLTKISSSKEESNVCKAINTKRSQTTPEIAKHCINMNEMNEFVLSCYLLNQQFSPEQQWHHVDLSTKYTYTEISQGKDLFPLVKSVSVQKGLF